jgi:hypothetical protein
MFSSLTAAAISIVAASIFSWQKQLTHWV